MLCLCSISICIWPYNIIIISNNVVLLDGVDGEFILYLTSLVSSFRSTWMHLLHELTKCDSYVQSGVDLVRGIVKEVQKKKLVLTDGTELAYGLLVWSTGVGASTFVKGLSLPKSPGGRYGAIP